MRTQRIQARRSGVILMVVLALLTLFAIVGLTFVFYAQGQQTASLHWREASFEQFARTGEVAQVATVDLLKANAGQIDFSKSRPEIEALLKSATALRDEVCRAAEVEQDPAERRRLEEMCLTQQRLVKALARLLSLIHQIEPNPNPSRD